MGKKMIRVLVAKPGLDGHDRGVKVIARALRDAGMEVVYTGLHQTAEQIVSTAVQEDVDIVGLSILSGAHMTFFPKVRRMLNESGCENVCLIGGGTLPDEDLEELLKGNHADALFIPGTPVEHIVNWINNKFAS